MDIAKKRVFAGKNIIYASRVDLNAQLKKNIREKIDSSIKTFACVVPIGPTLIPKEARADGTEKPGAAQRVFEAAGKEELKNELNRIKAKWREGKQTDHLREYALLSVDGLDFVDHIHFVSTDGVDKTNIRHKEYLESMFRHSLEQANTEEVDAIIIPNIATGEGKARVASVNGKHEAVKKWCEGNIYAKYPKYIILAGSASEEDKASFDANFGPDEN